MVAYLWRLGYPQSMVTDNKRGLIKRTHGLASLAVRTVERPVGCAIHEHFFPSLGFLYLRKRPQAASAIRKPAWKINKIASSVIRKYRCACYLPDMRCHESK
jgi:hypothetical protein